MSEFRGILERESNTVDLPPGAFERLLRRRDRKQRSRRIATAALALILATAAIGAVIRAFSGAERQLPAGTVKDINPGTAGSDIGPIANLGGTLYLSADDGTHGLE
ncbi:MAG: hypothetical protein ACRDFR_05670, partial [Candidatus Limnocylindria bacterium]